MDKWVETGEQLRIESIKIRVRKKYWLLLEILFDTLNEPALQHDVEYDDVKGSSPLLTFLTDKSKGVKSKAPVKASKE